MNLVTGLRNEPSYGGRLGPSLGWFSLALGAAELAMPEMLARTIGIDPRGRTATIVRIMGAREIVEGLGVLLGPRRALPLWARVAGDIVDLALLGYAARSKRVSGARILGAVGMVAGVTALDVIASRRVTKAREEASRPVIATATINRAPHEVYAFWRNLERLPMFMEYLESVHDRDGESSHWVARLPFGGTVEWDAQITEDRPGEVIAWESIEDSPIRTSGRVTFTKTPGRDMTEVRVELQLGVFGDPKKTLARFFSRAQVRGDLRRLKQVIETGEVLYSDASAHRLPHPAQPSLDSELDDVTMEHVLAARTTETGALP